MFRCFASMTLLMFFLALPGASQAPAPVPDEAPPTFDILNARTPFEGVLTGGQVTEEALAAAAAAGYRTVVNLRTLEEEGAWDETAVVEGLGMRFVHLPMAGGAGLTEDNARALAAVLDEPENYPVLIHCGSGNRVGALLALKAFQLDGKRAEEALEIGHRAGLTRLEPAVRERLGIAEPGPDAPENPPPR
jgi:uncharacterized protein (TIGR01244 family)